jgi:hypothetical protein
VINASSASGRWQFTLDGGSSWRDLGTVSSRAARLLAADMLTRVRFLPNANYNGTQRLTFRAWDRTQGSAGELRNLQGSIGHETAFSTAYTHAMLAVMAVNDAPTLTGISGTIGYRNNTTAIQIAPTATVHDADGADFDGGKLTVRITTAMSTANRIQLSGTKFTIDAQGQLRYSGLVIGTLNDNAGVGLTNFEATFNANATSSIIQQLVRVLRFRTVGGSPTGARMILFTLSDGDGGQATAMKSVQMV